MFHGFVEKLFALVLVARPHSRAQPTTQNFERLSNEMDLITPPTQAQKALFSTLATGTDFVLTVGPQKTLKAEFARLAKTKGWEGGSEEWNKYWHECFGEEYTYRGRRK